MFPFCGDEKVSLFVLSPGSINEFSCNDGQFGGIHQPW